MSLDGLARKLRDFADGLHNVEGELDLGRLEGLANAAAEVGRAWSGSWFGYHSRVYYLDFLPPPPGAAFSMESGLYEPSIINDTRGEWKEYDFDTVINQIYTRSQVTSLDEYEQASKEAVEIFEDSRSELSSLLRSAMKFRPNDPELSEFATQVKELRLISAQDVIKFCSPSGQFASRDMVALQAGPKAPPHLTITSQIAAIRSPFDMCAKLETHARRAATHLEIMAGETTKTHARGTKVFIGHGHSKDWKDLKDFIQDRLTLPWDEFNRIPVAGVTNVARLSKMLDEAAIAFIVMTAEDEQADGTHRARMNVIHEAGLFQGRLGFERAIVLLEEGCSEFSNIAGLGQIRFPKNRIDSTFETVRLILEREDLSV